MLVNENTESDDKVIKRMAQPMKEKFDKYYGDYSMILSLEVVLDPRIKL